MALAAPDPMSVRQGWGYGEPDMKHLRQSTRTTRRRLNATAFLLALGMTFPAAAQSSGSGANGASSSSARPASGATSTGSTSGSSASSTGDRADSMHTNTGGTAASRGTSTSAAMKTDASPESKKFLQKAAKSGVKEVHLSRIAAERSQNPAVRDYAEMLVSDHHQANARLTALARSRGVEIPSAGMTGTQAAKYSMVPGKQTTGNTGAPAATPPTVTGGQAGAQAPAGGSASARTSPDTRTAAAPANDDVMLNDAMREAEKEAQKLADKSGAEFDRAYVECMIKDHKDTIALFEKAGERTDDPEISSFAQATLPKLRAHLSQAESLQRQVEG